MTIVEAEIMQVPVIATNIGGTSETMINGKTGFLVNQGDIEEIEREIAEKRHFSSTNRWIPVGDIKNGYVIGDKHTRLISDAAALDHIMF